MLHTPLVSKQYIKQSVFCIFYLFLFCLSFCIMWICRVYLYAFMIYLSSSEQISFSILNCCWCLQKPLPSSPFACCAGYVPNLVSLIFFPFMLLVQSCHALFSSFFLICYSNWVILNPFHLLIISIYLFVCRF